MKRFLGIIWHSRITKIIILAILIIAISPVLIFSGMWIGCRSDPIVNLREANAVTDIETSKKNITGYSRNEEQTYLTFPEWYIVYSAEEYATSLATNPPSKFPYFRSVGQYWKSYCNVYAITRDNYPFNFGYHVILFVIGSSFSAENIVKGIYENTIGRVTELLSTSDLTEEDRYAQKVAAEYGTFLHTIPWYEFPFKDKLEGLWRETALWGPNPIRKWERKIILSAEYGFKSIYGWIIGGGTKTAYAPAELEIYAVVESFSESILPQFSDVRLIEKINSQYSIIVTPRYEAFTQIVPRLTNQGVKFVEVASNDEILVSVIAPTNWEPNSGETKILFTMPVLVDHSSNRVAMNVPVNELHAILDYLKSGDIKLEHIYDY